MIAPTFKGFIDEPDIKKVIAALKQENLMDLENLIKRADNFVNGQYVFQNDWDMEKTNEIEYLDLKNMNWNHNPKGDPEWTYMLNRQAFLLDVSWAYQVTQDVSYLNYVREFILSFIEEAPLDDQTKQTSWRTIDASLRITNWVRVFEIISPDVLFNKEEQQLVLSSLEQHLAYINQELSISRGQSNWVVIEICGLISGSLMIGQESELKASLDLLKICLELQVEGDGLQREQSFMYHHEVLLCLLMIVHLLQRNDQEVPSWLMGYGTLMSQASMNIMTGSGNQVAYGDSDIESMIGLLEVCENVFEEAFLPSYLKQEQTTLFTKLFIGLDNQNLAERRDLLVSTYFKNSGLSVLRNQTNSDYLLFKCGPLGGGHGHDDLLHIELEINQTPILVDSGRYSYEVEHHKRLDFKEASAHNTITINQSNFNRHTDAWNSLKVATPMNQTFESKENCHFVEGGHLGYFDEGVLINRKIVWIEEGLWLVSDEVFTNKKVTVDSHFHFASPHVTKEKTGFKYQNKEVSLLIEASQGQGDFVLEECFISPEYNKMYQSQKLRYNQVIEETTVQTFILTSQAFKKRITSVPVFCEGEEMAKEVVEGFEITSDTGEKEYIIMQHQEPDVGRRAYQIKGNYVYGKVVFTKLQAGNTSLKRVILD